MIFKKNMNTSTTMSRQQLDIAKRQLDIDRRQLEIDSARALPEWWSEFWSSHPRSNKDCGGGRAEVPDVVFAHEQGYQKGYTVGRQWAERLLDAAYKKIADMENADKKSRTNVRRRPQIGEDVLYRRAVEAGAKSSPPSQWVQVSVVAVRWPPGEEPEVAVRMPDGTVRDTVLGRLRYCDVAAVLESNSHPF